MCAHPSTQQLCLPIDADFDVAFVNRLAQQEVYNKHLYRPNTYLHKWWARRCGTTFRAILKHLIVDPELRDFYAPGGLEGKIVLDPMSGGGTTLHEAIRMGANVIGADIDPIPILQARATLSDITLSDLTHAFNALHATLETQLAGYFETAAPCCARILPLRYVLYGQERHCACGNVIMVDALTLRQNRDRSVIHIDPLRHDIYCDQRVVSPAGDRVKLPLIEKQQQHCENCGQKYRDFISVPFFQRYVPLAVFGCCPMHGHFFKSVDGDDYARLSAADARRATLFERDLFSITPGPKSQHLYRRGVANYLDLFSSRQLLLLRAAVDILPELPSLVNLNLSLLISTSLEFNSMLCGYKGWHRRRPGAIKHAFVRHAYSLPYTALENNPLFGNNRSGTLHKLFQSRIVHARQWAQRPVERVIRHGKVDRIPIDGELDQGTEVDTVSDLDWGTHRFLLLHGSSAQLDIADDSVDYVVTDPPYYDSVQYDDLAEFFHVWLRQLLPAAAHHWQQTPEAAAVNPHNVRNGQYEVNLSKIFQESHRVLRSEQGRLIFTFHHWKAHGWAAVTKALRKAGFILINRYVVLAESPTSVHIARQKALLHDVVLVLGSAETTTAPTWLPPREIDKENSHNFCLQCGTLLGYLLASSDSDADITALWQQRLG